MVIPTFFLSKMDGCQDFFGPEVIMYSFCKYSISIVRYQFCSPSYQFCPKAQSLLSKDCIIFVLIL